MPGLNYIDVYFSVQSFHEEELRGKSAVIIDVLRASSSIVTAVHNGARKVIAVEDMGDAGRIASSMDSKDYLLCGEKNGIKIDGYHLGNSPLEYSEAVVKNKTVILNTTNGTKAIKKSGLANRVYVGCFLNQQSILNVLKEHDDEVVLICAGWQGRLSLEDTLFAGSLISKMCDGNLPEDTKDGVKVAFGLFEKFGSNIEEIISKSDHAKRLRTISPEDDVPYCSQVDLYDVLPGLKDGIITDIK